MSKINCNVTNCAHNKENVCYSNTINVGGSGAKKDCDTCCGAFLDAANYGHLTNNINNPGRECTSITCNVGTCMYNSNNLCNASTINVSGGKANIYTETTCETFKAK